MRFASGLLLVTAALFASIAHSAGSQNPVVHLGRKLFFEPQLSGTRQMSCASCHRPELGWSDGLPQAVGAHGNRLARRTPTLIDAGQSFSYFWDGRAETLEEQALMPIQNPQEMDQPIPELLERLQNLEPYPSLFQKAFGVIEITADRLAQALAAFERTIVHKPTEYEKWLDGDDNAISESAQRGFRLFFSARARCFHCHSGANFSDGRFWDIGTVTDDRGRGALYPDEPKLQYSFKTPVLWGVSKRGPYMHNGSEATLRDVLDLYDNGGRVRRDSVSDFIRPIGLSEDEKSDLIEFLRTI